MMNDSTITNECTEIGQWMQYCWLDYFTIAEIHHLTMESL